MASDYELRQIAKENLNNGIPLDDFDGPNPALEYLKAAQDIIKRRNSDIAAGGHIPAYGPWNLSPTESIELARSSLEAARHSHEEQ